jgi:protein disulfide-isomerase
VFSTESFKKWAAKNVILVEVDFPRRTELPSDLKRQNEELKNRFSIRGFPTILFLDSKEKVIGRSGYKPGGVESWIKDAERQIK